MTSIMFRTKPRINILSIFLRDKSVWTVDKVAKSPYADVVIPDLTLDQYMFRNLEKWATKTAAICAVTNRSYTYEQVYKKSRILAANLRKKLQVKDGDVIGVVLPNVPEFPIVTFGILAAGGVVTTMNPIYTAYEIERQILLSECKIIITNEEIAPIVKNAIKLSKNNIPIISLTTNQSLPVGTISYQELVEDRNIDLSVLKEVKRKYDDVALLPYSSGTTGLPKGVQLTNRNVVSNCEQQNTELRQYEYTTASHQDSILAVLPLFHSYGLGLIMLHKMSVGLRVVTLPRFQPETFLSSLLNYRIQLLYLAPPMVLFLGSHPNVTAKHFENISTVTSGAAPLPSADVQRLLHKVDRDIQFTQGYGLTEASPLVSIMAPGRKAYDDVGCCLPNMEMRIVNSNLKNLGPNEVGELLLRGPNIMKGYFNNPQANEETFDGEWLRTGDVGKVDENGLLTISDRLKELIKIKGYQVPPAELENVLKEHPAVIDAAVVAVPDPITGERPRAFVVLKQGVQATENEISEFVNERVAPYKKIKQITFLDIIPKSISGKILRKGILKQFS